MEEYSKSEKPNTPKEEVLRGIDYPKMREKLLSSGKYLKMDECRQGYLYILVGRQTVVGIYNEKRKAFTYNRERSEGESPVGKFLWHEHHCDIGAPLGTAFPIKEIEKAPEFANDEEKLEYLAKKNEELEPELEPEMERLTQGTD